MPTRAEKRISSMFQSNHFDAGFGVAFTAQAEGRGSVAWATPGPASADTASRSPTPRIRARLDKTRRVTIRAYLPPIVAESLRRRRQSQVAQPRRFSEIPGSRGRFLTDETLRTGGAARGPRGLLSRPAAQLRQLPDPNGRDDRKRP